MRPPSENFRSIASTFHSMSVGGRFCGLLKKISYSIFRRRNWVSSTFSSSSIVTGISANQCRSADKARARYRLGTEGYGTKVSGGYRYWLLRLDLAEDLISHWTPSSLPLR